MRVFDRLTAVVVALAFVLVGLGAPAHGETPGPGAMVTAAHRSIGQDPPSAPAPDGQARQRLQLGTSDTAPRPGAVVDAPVTTPGRTAPPSGDSRAVVARPAPPDAPPDLRTEVRGHCGDHRAGVVPADGPDDLLPAPPVPVGGPPHPGLDPTRYRPPALPLPPRGTLLARAPPTVA
ncbi:hypothetical protein [Micromonospora sp. CB01531]|uniref:hypothetical protein n=1 Tax=Micromonospora sp. CB01531 TaxID=1718947 RepID=UPI000939CAEC|nr:hypothetical protein [Micromonospora sp. CB01531]OKI68953.1 hypothetical protein A6A27_03635 [Micromonospora sp. CB01531]